MYRHIEKLSNIFSRVEKFREIQKPIMVKLGIQDEINKLHRELANGTSEIDEGANRVDAVQKQLARFIPELKAAIDQMNAGMIEIREASGELQNAGVDDFGGVPWEQADDIAEGMILEAERMLNAIKKF